MKPLAIALAAVALVTAVLFIVLRLIPNTGGNMLRIFFVLPLLLFALSAPQQVLADNHIRNALQHNNKTPQTFNPTSKDNGRGAADIPGRGAGQGSNPLERGNVGTPGAAKNGVVAPFAPPAPMPPLSTFR